MVYGIIQPKRALNLVERFAKDISTRESLSYDTIDVVAEKAVHQEPFTKFSNSEQWMLKIHARDYLVTLLQETEYLKEAEIQWNTLDKRMKRGGLAMLLTGILGGLYSCSEGSPPPQYMTIGTIFSGLGGTLYVLLYEDRVPKTRFLQNIAYRFTPAWKNIAEIRRRREFQKELVLLNFRRQEIKLEKILTTVHDAS